MHCPKCGNDNLEDAKQCQSCGQQISPPPTPTAKPNKGQLKRIALVAAAIMIIAVAVFIPAFIKIRKMACHMVCGTNLAGLGKAMLVYTNDDINEAYPPADKWCDLLVEKCETPKDIFCCPDSKVKVGKSSYVLNINAAGKRYHELPPDMVLIFETNTPGWNMTGGKELLSTTNHHGDGCNILYVDGRSKFIKDPNSLRWTSE